MTKATRPTWANKLRSRGVFNNKPALIISAALAVVALLATPKSDAASYTWNVATGNWSTPTSWMPTTTGPNGPLAADTVVFGNTNASPDGATVNNIVDSGFAGSISNLTFNSTTAGAFNVTQIAPNQTLNVTGALIVGGVSVNPALTQAYFVGGGSLNSTAPIFNVEDYNPSSATSIATLNLAGLSSFTYNNPAGTISIADTTAGLLRAGGILVLAMSNNITATNLNLSTSSAVNGGALSSLVFGPGTNIINVANFSVANNKNSAFVTNTGGGVKIRGLAGTDISRANITLGNRNAFNSSGVVTGSLLLNGCPVDIKAATLIVGEAPNNGGAPTSGFAGNGVLQFDTGVIDATALLMGSNTSANNGASLGSSSGLVTVGANAKLIVGGGGLSLASQTLAGPSTGVLTISNGTVVCNGNISISTNVVTSSIIFTGGGNLTLGAGNVAGTAALPIGTVTLDNNVTLQLTLPSATQPSIVANTLNWAPNDSTLTIKITSLPAGLTPGSTIPLFTSVNALGGGAVASPVLSLPAGVTGNISVSNTTILLTLTGGVGPGIGGLNQLVNPGFESAPNSTGWTTVGNANTINTGSATYYNAGTCPPDSPAQLVITHSGLNVANAYGRFSGNTSWSQSTSTVAGTIYTASAYTLASHEDLMTGRNSFKYAVNFRDSDGALLAAYQSYIVTNLTCGQVGGPFPLDTWNLLAVTNQMQVINGTNTGVVIGNIPSAVLTAPPGAATVQFQALFNQPANDGGSIYFDDVNLGFISGPTAPTISALSPNLVTLSTNTALTCTAASSPAIITNVQIIVKITTLGSTITNTITNGLTSTNLTITGIGTQNVSISYALTPNTIYRSIVVKVTDVNGTTVSSSSAVLDTLQPTLVIEAADFNYSNGGSMDTPANGGLALFQGQVGVEGVDEHKTPRAAAQSYYRPGDAVIIQGAAPNTGAPPSGTEQKFVTAAANGDTNDIEVEAGFNSVGDWLNYTRTYGSGGSAPAGTYNVWAYLATSGSGVQATLSQVTSDPTQGNQTSNVLGNFGTPTFTDASFNSYVYVPLVDQFGNRVSVTLGAGKQTLKSTVVGNPNLGFYILVPVAPILAPALQNVYPDGTVPFQFTNKFSFTVGPANGAPLTTAGIDLVINGVDVSSGLTFTPVNNSYTVTYPIASNGVYSAVITVTNSGGLVSIFPVNFDTFNINNYQWEAVDYDFSTNTATTVVSGLFIDNPVPTCEAGPTPQTGVFATNSYFGYPTGLTPGNDPFANSFTGAVAGAIAVQGIDIHFLNAGQSTTSEYYRNDGVGQEVTTDYIRPKFLAARTNFNDPLIGPIDIGFFANGYWMNYTRNYPTNNYNVWGRLAGGAGPFSGTTLSVVTSGVGTAIQTSNVLGTFSDPNASGWQSWHWVPLRDPSGNMVAVPLHGRATLNLTSGNNLNAEFFMLTVAPVQLKLGAAPSTSIPGQIGITIATQTGHTYTLQTATSITGPWTQVGTAIPGDGNSHVINQATSNQQGYFRVLVQ